MSSNLITKVLKIMNTVTCNTSYIPLGSKIRSSALHFYFTCSGSEHVIYNYDISNPIGPEKAQLRLITYNPSYKFTDVIMY